MKFNAELNNQNKTTHYKTNAKDHQQQLQKPTNIRRIVFISSLLSQPIQWHAMGVAASHCHVHRGSLIDIVHTLRQYAQRHIHNTRNITSTFKHVLLAPRQNREFLSIVRSPGHSRPPARMLVCFNLSDSLAYFTRLPPLVGMTDWTSLPVPYIGSVLMTNDCIY